MRQYLTALLSLVLVIAPLTLAGDGTPEIEIVEDQIEQFWLEELDDLPDEVVGSSFDAVPCDAGDRLRVVVDDRDDHGVHVSGSWECSDQTAACNGDSFCSDDSPGYTESDGSGPCYGQSSEGEPSNVDCYASENREEESLQYLAEEKLEELGAADLLDKENLEPHLVPAYASAHANVDLVTRIHGDAYAQVCDGQKCVYTSTDCVTRDGVTTWMLSTS